MVKHLLLILCLIMPCSVHAEPQAHGMVVAAQQSAAQAGIDMLKQGGNAFDAAAATARALGVVEPGSSGIGGGGFFLLYIAKEKRYVMIDARETAPKLAGNGEVYESVSSIDGPASAGVPGLAAGVDHLVGQYGELRLSDVTAPAIELARNGFEAGERLKGMLKWRGKVFNEAARYTYLSGETIRQEALAETLERFAKGGADDFYRGETAGRLVADMKREGGLIREDDLATYRAIERQPVAFDYQGYRFISASLPSSGGLTLAHIFGQLQDDDLGSMSRTDRVHLLVEAMKRAYRDRNAHLGDADFMSVPENYLDPVRLKQLRASILMDRAIPSNALAGFAEPMGASVDTTHFSVIDADGNMVSATLSINYGFGSGYVSPSTGILLNDEMDDFATRPG
ncbi:MAG: gamma-glutamyltransferase family protein, partial [Mariprofundus sp.]